ncbi:MAG TPA: hypothetical protein VH373_11255 [Jatrophihabitantaceae bacterium]
MTETPTQLLHRVTSYDLVRDWDAPFEHPQAIGDFVSTDLSTLPYFYKRYPAGLPRVPLPRELPTTTVPAVAVLAGTTKVPPASLDLPQIARLLHLSAGVVRTSQRSYGPHPFRAAGSAGGRFPLEVYVAVPDGTELPAGLHWYDAQDHALVLVGPPPDAGAPTLVVTGIPWRTGWRYRERGYRHIYWDAGTMLAQTLAVADSAGITAELYSRFPDTQVTQLVGADGVQEFPVAVVALGGGPPALAGDGPAAPGEVDAAPREFPLVTSAQHAGDADTLGTRWPRGESVDVEGSASDPVEAVVLVRGSQRLMDAGRGLPLDTLRTSMRIALRGIDLPHHVVVHDVDGLEPGVYRWPDLSAPTRPGRLRERMYQVCLDQGLGRDAAFVAIAATDVGRLDDHEYRDVHLAAGLAMSRLHLVAYGLGASASGMTFIDSEMPELLGEPVDGLLLTCVGVPEYKSSPGGRPGDPTAVRRMQPRL